jgi:hypothetical protein
MISKFGLPFALVMSAMAICFDDECPRNESKEID